jgi:lysozyme
VALHAHYGKKPVIYTDINFHEDVLEGTHEFDDYPFWIRSTAAKPEERYEKRPWEFWQFTTTGRVPGITGDVDRNAFFGSEKDFAGWREGRYDIGSRKWQDSTRPLHAKHAAPAEKDKVAAEATPRPAAKPRQTRTTESRSRRLPVSRALAYRDPASTGSIIARDRN